MVSYNHIIRKNLRLQRAANSQRLQWYQSRWFDTWKKKPTYHQWNNHEMRYSLSNGTAEVIQRNCCNRRLSHETRAMLKAKIKENEAYNTSGVCATLKQTRKDKRARCFACKERGHVVWNCPHKRNKMKGKIEASQPRYTVKILKYPKCVHLTTDFMVNGSKDWNRIWYISKEYKNHMTPVKSNFKRMKGEFKMLEKEERQRKFIFSYGVGEAFVETENGTKVISNVFYTPEITLNVLSLEQLENQGYVVTVEGNKCVIKYMFDEDRGMLDANEDRDMVEDSTAMVKSHNEYLDDYFKSIDPTEECSLIKGMEDLKMKEEDTHDYCDDGNGRPQGDARMEDAEVEEGKPDKTQGTDDQDDVKKANNSSVCSLNKEHKGHRSNNYSESKRNDHLDNNRRQEQRNKDLCNVLGPSNPLRYRTHQSVSINENVFQSFNSYAKAVMGNKSVDMSGKYGTSNAGAESVGVSDCNKRLLIHMSSEGFDDVGP
ncbi:ARID DNA-binding domain-containing protein [Tanacetum coccineum]|uniref:ARID DNA-binding domain-containing protein n=1 Tax=Tanacetum coccineum TaxID=301880 RepID=A0ABQ5FCS4_9ASTR